jgi:glutamyl-tRNA reductase
MEIYAIGGHPNDLHRLRRAFGAWRALGERHLKPYVYAYAGKDAVRHLFRTAAGLDSMVVGETQILGQVREALETSKGLGFADREIASLFTSAIRTGRRARAETAIARSGASIPSVAVELARQTLGTLEGRRVLVVGAGKIGALSAKAFLGSGAASLTVVNRSLDRSQDLAAALGGTALPFSSLEDALSSVDVVVSGTTATDTVIPADMVRRAMAQRKGAALLLVDIAVPRDVSPEAASVPGVHLYNVDDLTAIAQRNMDLRSAEIESVERILDEELDKFEAWQASLLVQPTIRAIHQEAEDVRRREVNEALRKLAHLSKADQDVVDALSRVLVNKILHTPFQTLRETPQDEAYITSVRRLFRLQDGDVRDA